MTFLLRHRLPVIYQSENAECGLACVAMVAGFYGHSIDLPLLRERCNASMRGTSLRELTRIAKSVGMTARVLKVEPEVLSRLRCPAVLHWDMCHFVVLKRVSRRFIEIHDPNRGLVKVSMADVGKHLSGIAVELFPGEGFERKNEYRQVKIAHLIDRDYGLPRKLLPVVALAIAAQVLVVIVPYYFQIAIDRVVPNGNIGLLRWLTLLFIAFVVVDWFVKYVRNNAALQLGVALNSHLSNSLLARLLRLPLSFFESRSISGVVAKFDSLEEVRAIICEDGVRLLVDGLMCAALICVLLVYQPGLTAWILLFAAAYFFYRLVTFQRFRLITEEQIVRHVQQKNHLQQSVQNASVMKAYAAEEMRSKEWAVLLSKDIQGDHAIRRSRANFELTRDGMLGVETVITGYFALSYVLAGTMTLGMVFAFFTYKRLFSISAFSLIEISFKIRALRIHLDHLADIVGTSDGCTADDSSQAEAEQDFGVSLHFDAVSFAYAGSEDRLIDRLSFTIKPGERAALVGPSGVGKTTVLKLLLRLIEPSSGSIRLGDVDISTMPRAQWLARIGAVLQGQSLFNGSIRENISFGASTIEDSLVAAAAQAACIDSDIEALPMGYETPLGDRGGVLSGGQIQRILIARAIYRQPSLLVMDEGTANLDRETEERILRNITALGITVIHAAHRPQVVDNATQVIRLGAPLGGVTRHEEKAFENEAISTAC